MTVVWEPYFLDRNIPEGGVPLKDYLVRKYGDAMMNRYAQMSKHLNDAGSAVGIAFQSERKVYNTMNAHIIMEWCKQTHPDKSDALYNLLVFVKVANGMLTRSWKRQTKSGIRAG